MDGRSWNNNIVDVLPNVAAKFLKRDIVILNASNEKLIINHINHGNFEMKSKDNRLNYPPKSSKKLERKLDFHTDWFTTPLSKIESKIY